VQVIPGTDEYRFNYWGYSTVGFFAPMSRYSAAAAAGKPAAEVVREFKTLVKECHKRGIEVILDVVFNHTAEGNQNGPSLSFRQAPHHCLQHLHGKEEPVPASGFLEAECFASCINSEWGLTD
jgi:hypothetical protein